MAVNIIGFMFHTAIDFTGWLLTLLPCYFVLQSILGVAVSIIDILFHIAIDFTWWLLTLSV